MLSMKPLLEWLPDLRLIHLVRDPRPVALSRRDFEYGARGQFADSTRNISERVIREAGVYCRQVVADVRWKRRLEQQFPGRLYSLTYEQLVDDPVGRASDIYRFIQETPGPFVIDSFAKLANGKQMESAKYLAARWLRGRISQSEYDGINKECAEFFSLYPEYSKYKPEIFRTTVRNVRNNAPEGLKIAAGNILKYPSA
jgi:Sulfotransferase family